MADNIHDLRVQQAEETREHYEQVLKDQESAQDEWLEANSLDLKGGTESPEEAAERVQRARATGIFGDTPTDPTIGDIVVPSADQEEATQSVAEVDAAAEAGDEEAEDLSPEEAARQSTYGLDEEDVESLDESDDEEEESSELSAADKVERIEAATSVEEVDELAEGDDRVTVQRAAEKKRSSWS